MIYLLKHVWTFICFIESELPDICHARSYRDASARAITQSSWDSAEMHGVRWRGKDILNAGKELSDEGEWLYSGTTF